MCTPIVVRLLRSHKRLLYYSFGTSISKLLGRTEDERKLHIQIPNTINGSSFGEAFTTPGPLSLLDSSRV